MVGTYFLAHRKEANAFLPQVAHTRQEVPAKPNRFVVPHSGMGLASARSEDVEHGFVFNRQRLDPVFPSCVAGGFDVNIINALNVVSALVRFCQAANAGNGSYGVGSGRVSRPEIL